MANETQYRTAVINRTERVREIFNTEFTDKKGRVIGCRVSRFELDTVQAAPDASSYFTSLEPNVHFFMCCVQATRNGQDYGAGQTDMYFKTLAERETYIAKRVADSNKAAAKKAGK